MFYSNFMFMFYSDVYSVSKLPVPLRTTNKHYTILLYCPIPITHNQKPIQVIDGIFTLQLQHYITQNKNEIHPL
jgi:hypothetical protein